MKLHYSVPQLDEIVTFLNTSGPVTFIESSEMFFTIHDPTGYYNIDLGEFILHQIQENKGINTMARETKEQRQAREAQEQMDAELAMAEYYKTVPKRLLEAQALAQNLGVSANLSLTESGPSVHFEYKSESENVYIDTTITYQTEQWELESLESSLESIKAAHHARRQRLIIAQAIFDRITPFEKAAIKEHIYTLR